MARIPVKAILSNRYMNQCVPVTCVTYPSEAGVLDSIIMATSCHKFVEAVKNYSRPTENALRCTATILDKEGEDEVDELLALATPAELAELEMPSKDVHRGAKVHVEKPSSSGRTQAISFTAGSFSECTSIFDLFLILL